MKAFILFAIFVTLSFAQVQNCIVGSSRCDGTDANCACQNGGLCKPDGVTCNCTTPLVYSGAYCQTPQCVGANFPNGCVNGTCVAPGNCQCNPGWSGFDCSVEIQCTSGTSLCTSAPCACNGRGQCDSTGKACKCNPGYAGTFCEIIVCNAPFLPQGCNSGKCSAPDACTCNPGWNGTDCGTPLCYPSCIYGTCNGPNTCTCSPGYAQCEGQLPLCGCDENECLRANKPCDPVSTCTNTFGGYTCSACPTGYIGQPYLTYPIAGNITYYTGGCNETASSVPTARTTATSTPPTTAATTAPTTATSATAGTTTVATGTSATSAATTLRTGTSATTANNATATSNPTSAAAATSNVRIANSTFVIGDQSSASIVVGSLALLCFLL